MAELPRYRPLGARISGMPSVDFVQTGRAQAQIYDTIGNALDKISEFAFEKAVAQAEQEGLQYGYKNALTPDQINMALRGELSLDDIVEDPGTVFGKASKAAIASQLRVDLEGAARAQLAEYNAIIEGGGDYNIAEIEAGIMGVIDGHAGLIAQLDVEEAQTYAATVNTLASATYKTALKTHLDKVQAIKIAASDKSIAEAESLFRQIYDMSAGETIKIDGKIYTDADTAADVLTKSLYSTAVNTNDGAYIKSAVKAVDNARIKARKDVLVAHGIEFSGKSEAERALVLKQRQFGNKQSLFDSFSEIEQLEIINAIRTELTNQTTQMVAAKEENKQLMLSQAADLAGSLMEAKPGSTKETEIFAELNRIFIKSDGEAGILFGSSQYNTLMENRRKTYEITPPRNYANEFALKQEIFKGKITNHEQLLDRATEIGIDVQYVIPMMTTVNEETRRAEAKVDKVIKNMARIVPNTQITDAQAAAYFKLSDQLTEEHIKMVSEWEASGAVGEAPTRLDAVNKMLPEVLNSPYRKQIDEFIDNLNRSYGQNGTLLNTNIIFTQDTNYNDIVVALENSGANKAQLARVQRILGSINEFKKELYEID
jgi:hypothetical protein